jgi:hypothetical protein
MIAEGKTTEDLDLVMAIECFVAALRELGRENGTIRSSYANVGSRADDRWGIGASRHILLLLREAGVIHVSPITGPGNLQLERTIKIRTPLDDIPSIARSVARRPSFLPATIMKGSYRLLNPFAAEIAKEQHDRQRQEGQKRDEQDRRRNEDVIHIVRGWADGYCQGCDREDDDLVIVRSGKHPIHYCGSPYAYEPEHLIALCPKCAEVHERWQNGSARVDRDRT